MVDEQTPWPPPPREPGPWGGGPPVAPPGNTPLPPLPGAGGTMQTSPGSTNPWAAAGSSPGTPSPPPPQARNPFPGLPTGPKLVDRAPIAVVVASAIIVLALVAGGAYIVLNKGPSYPKEWNPKVRAIAEWVAKDRKLEFDHKVEVLFLTPAEYTKASTGEDEGADASAAPTDASKKENEQQVANLRALGFLQGDLDLDAAGKTLQDSGSLAFYSPDTKKIYIRGETMTPSLRVTLAHELTHVLQDQHFDLGRIDHFTDGRASVMRAIAEGDATRIEDDYKTKVLTKAEQAEYDKQSKAEGDKAQTTLDKKVPDILTTFFAAPYILGPELVKYLAADGGAAKIDAALTDVPTEEVLFNPLTSGTPEAAAKAVTLDNPVSGDPLDEGEFGPTAWYLMLATRVDAHVALRAVDGWGGDHYVVYEESGKVCESVKAEMDTPKDATELTGALMTWVGKSPKGTASVSNADGTISFKTCDPGKDAKLPGTTATTDLLSLPAARTDIYVSVVAQVSASKASCYANAVVDGLTIAQLNSPELTPAMNQVVATARTRCI